MNLLVTIPMDPQQRQALAAIAPEAEVVYTAAEAVTPDQVSQAEIILGNLPIPLLQYASRLKWLQLNYAGSDNYAAPGVLPEGVILTNASGCYGLAISECMLAGILQLIKRLDQYQRNQAQHIWRNEGAVSSIEGSTTLVVGFGDIGSSFAQRMHALGSTVIGIRRNVTGKPDYISALYQMDALDRLLPLADFVSLSLPNSPQTQKVMGARQFAEMKDSAILVNTSRGPLIDTDALLEVLRQHKFAAVALDVYEDEDEQVFEDFSDNVLANDKVALLLAFPNVIVTSHQAFFTHTALQAIAQTTLENARAFQRGEPLANRVE